MQSVKLTLFTKTAKVFPVAYKKIFLKYYHAHRHVKRWVIFSETELNKKVKVKWR